MQQLSRHKPAAAPCPEMLLLMTKEAEHAALVGTHAHVLTVHAHVWPHRSTQMAHTALRQMQTAVMA